MEDKHTWCGMVNAASWLSGLLSKTNTQKETGLGSEGELLTENSNVQRLLLS